jgi:hypothetical protein
VSEPTPDAEASLAETFDWHSEPEGVLKWALPTLLAELPGGADAHAELARRTRNWSRVELRVLVNDVELPARRLLEGLVRSLDFEVDRVVARRLRQVSWLETLTLHVEALERALAERVRDAAVELNVPLHLLEEDE